MLKRLYIKDFAIVDELEVIFGPGFQVITGETGAGKSILVGAIGYLCGDRGSSEVVRAGAQKAIMEAEFEVRDSASVRPLLEEMQVEEMAKVLILRREMNDKGVSRVFVNDTPVTVNALAQLSDELIDLHGQHQHQRLLRPETHIEYLDSFGQLLPVRNEYITAFKNYRSAVDELSGLQTSRDAVLEKQDLFRFQVDELTRADITAGEFDELTAELKILENSELLFDKAQAVADILTDGDDAVLDRVVTALNHLKQVAEIDPVFNELLAGLESARVTLQETGRECAQYGSRLEFDPARLERIRERLAELEWLMKKYHVRSDDDLADHLKSLQSQLNTMENFDHEIAQWQKAIETRRKVLQEIAEQLSQKRKDAALVFARDMNSLLHSVGLPNAAFTVHFDYQTAKKGEIILAENRCSALETGIDIVEFQIGINPGEPVKPLHKVASGGEVSRIMLCIKSLLADTDAIETLVFDEIDIGISGQIARVVAKKMRAMAGAHQLIVITHLPQIAAQGETHFAVRKFESNGRTVVRVQSLDEEQRVEEIAQLLAGDSITSTSRENARELMKDNQKI